MPMLAAGQPEAGRKARPGDRCIVHYEGRLEDGSVFDSTLEREPITFALGKGQVVRGFEQAVLGLSPGDSVEVVLPPELAYGEPRDNLLIEMPASAASSGLVEGSQVTLQNSRGQDLPAKVIRVNEDGSVVCDANHRLAGKTLTFKIDLLGFREVVAPAEPPEGLKLATFAAGPFWCLELVFQRVPGVVHTCAGYTQGHVQCPSFEDVKSGRTGHAQAVRVVYDPAEVTFEALLEAFWEHLGFNATTRDEFGDDRGPMFRSGIYYHDAEQQHAADAAALGLQMRLKRPVVTEVQEASASFWLAEDRHQRYLERGGGTGRPQSAAKGCTDEIRPYG